VVQSAEQANRGDARPRVLDAFAWNRNPLTNSLVRSRPVEIAKCIFSKYLPKVRLSEDNPMIEAFAPDAPGEPFAHRIHQWRTHSRSKDANPSAFGRPIEDGAELVVAIADNELRSLSEGRCVSQLLGSPCLGRSTRHPNVDDAFGRDIDNEKREDRTKPYVISLQKVARPHGVVSQECSPALSAAWRWRPRSSHISLNRSLRYANAELEQLATNALGSPQAVVGRHALDEDSDVRSEARLAHVDRRGFSTPKKPKSLAMPADDRLGLDEQDGLPRVPSPRTTGFRPAARRAFRSITNSTR
jgi:hypothetical protein